MATVIRYVAFENYVGAASGVDVAGRQSLGKLIDAAWLTTFNVATLFFTAGSLLFFYLLLKSRFIPRALSAFGAIASVLLAALAALNLIVPELPPAAEPASGYTGATRPSRRAGNPVRVPGCRPPTDC
jgi:hypothetical protein